MGLVAQSASGQTKKPSDAVFVKAQIKPKFSEMVDYGSPTNKEGIHEFPGGKAPVSNQINSNGSIRINKTGEITVPTEVIRNTEKLKGPNADNDPRRKKKGN